MSAKHALIAAALSLAALTACGQPAATPTPTTASAPVLPAPTATPTAEAPPPTPMLPALPTPTAPPTPAPTAAAPVFTRNEAAPSLPDSIAFSAALESDTPIETLDVEFGRNTVFSCASASYTTARTDIEPGAQASRRSGRGICAAPAPSRQAPPSGGAGAPSTRRDASTAPSAANWTTRTSAFDWRSHQAGNITYYWYAGGDDFGRKLADGRQRQPRQPPTRPRTRQAHQGVRLRERRRRARRHPLRAAVGGAASRSAPTTSSSSP